MAKTKHKATYSLNRGTLERVQKLSAAWKISKSEVIRRGVDQLSEPEKGAKKVPTPLEALESLQKNGISAKVAAEWNKEILLERRAWGRKRR